jgi:membrane-associated protease RseP (regulator of RpoE activity)
MNFYVSVGFSKDLWSNQMSSFVFNLLVIELIIIIHELGHFAAAKWVGLSVIDFSVGVGKEIFSFHFQKTKFQLCVIPFGGGMFKLKALNSTNFLFSKKLYSFGWCSV